MKCPKCNDEELACDEVDIGVGTLKGNYYCNNCGWSEGDNPESYLDPVIDPKSGAYGDV